MEQFHKDDPCEHHAPFPNVENTKFIEMRQRILDAFQRFSGAPFTVQRICELVTQPKKHYTQCDKFLRGIEKNVMVVSTVDPCGRKIVSESRGLVNGLDMNGVNNQPREDENDITDGQPFASMPVADWTNNVATVWPKLPASDDKNNSSSVSEEQNKVDKSSDIQPDEKDQENTDSGRAKAVSDTENSENQLVVKDSVVKDSAHKDVSSTSQPSEPQDLAEKSENKNSENIISQQISKDRNMSTETQSSEMPLDGEQSGDTNDQTEVSTDNKDGSAVREKHPMEVTDSSADEPPEKKLKVDHSDDAPAPEDEERTQVSNEPIGDKNLSPDSTSESSEAEKSSVTSAHSDQSESTVDSQCKTLEQKDEQSEAKAESTESSKMTQNAEGNIVSGDSQSEGTTQPAVQPDQSLDSLQNTRTAECDSAGEHVSVANVSAGNAENIKTDENQQESDGSREATEDGNSTEDVMETDAEPENKDATVEKAETLDESEPMDQE